MIHTWLAEVAEFTLKLDCQVEEVYETVAMLLKASHKPGCAATVDFWTGKPYGRERLAVLHGCTCRIIESMEVPEG